MAACCTLPFLLLLLTKPKDGGRRPRTPRAYGQFGRERWYGTKATPIDWKRKERRKGAVLGKEKKDNEQPHKKGRRD